METVQDRRIVAIDVSGNSHILYQTTRSSVNLSDLSTLFQLEKTSQ